MPATDVSMMLRAADRLEAIERMGAIQDRSVSSGYAKAASVRSHMRYLRDRAEAGMPKGSQRGPVTPGGSLASLRAAGVAVNVVKRSANG